MGMLHPSLIGLDLPIEISSNPKSPLTNFSWQTNTLSGYSIRNYRVPYTWCSSKRNIVIVFKRSANISILHRIALPRQILRWSKFFFIHWYSANAKGIQRLLLLSQSGLRRTEEIPRGTHFDTKLYSFLNKAQFWRVFLSYLAVFQSQ